MSRRGLRARGGKKRATKKAATGKRRAGFAGMPANDPRAQVARILAEPDPRKRWQMEQALAMAEAVRVAEADARREHEATQRLKDVGSYGGPDLGEMLKSKRG